MTRTSWWARIGAYGIFPNLMFLFCSSSLDAALVHKYSFNDGTANDSVGTADFTLQGSALVGGGALNLPGGAHKTNYALAEGAALSELAATLDPTDLASALSIEVWFTQNQFANWSKLFMAGIDMADAFVYMDITPRRGDGTNYSSASLNSGEFNGANENNAQSSTVLSNNVDYYFAAVWDNTTYDDVSAGTLTFHAGPVGGTLATSSVALSIDNFLNGMTIEAAYLGAAVQFGDPDFNGLIDELRIHNSALTQGEVDASFATGADPFFGPMLTVNRDTGGMQLSNGSAPIQIVGLDITSAAGGLNAGDWLSITDNYDADSGSGFDALNTWVVNNADVYQLSESATAGSGGTLAGTPLDLGEAWLQSPIEDVQITAMLSDGSTLPLAVEFEGNGGEPLARSDLNFDGVVNAQDWPIFLSGNLIDMSALSPIEAYRMGDLNGDQVNNYTDFQIFASDYDAVNGAGAFAALVPEPGSCVLALCGLLCLAGRRFRS